MGSPPKTGRVHPVEPTASLSQGLSDLITRDVQWSASGSDFLRSRLPAPHRSAGRHPPGSAGVPPAPSSCKQDASHRLRLRLGPDWSLRGALPQGEGCESAPFPLDRRQSRPAWLGQAPGRAGRPRSRGTPLLTGCIAYASSVLMDDSMLFSGLATSKGRQSRVTSSRSRYRSELVKVCVRG